MIDVAIVILNYKMRAQVEKTLAGIFRDVADAPFSVKVVVADNDSGDGLLTWVAQQYPEVLCMQHDGNYGYAYSNNRAMEAVEARYYMILNHDTELTEPRTIQRLYEWMEARPSVAVCGPRLIAADGSLQHSCHRFPSLTVQLVRRTPFARNWFFKKRIDKFLLKDYAHTAAHPVDWVQGSALVVRGAAIAHVGMLDERFWMYFEDTDWCRRFWDAGWHVYYVPEITIMHSHGRGSARVPGVIKPLFTNKLARAHLRSWSLYFWKWRRSRITIF